MSKRKDNRRDLIETPAAAGDATSAIETTAAIPAEDAIAAAPQSEIAAAETNTFSMPEIELAAPRIFTAQGPVEAEALAAPAAETLSPPASKRFPLLAASVALAAAIGAVLGSLGSMGLHSAPVTGADAKLTDVTRLQTTLTQVNADVAALKASIENSNRLATTQFSKIGERLDRNERAQAEPAAKLSTIVDSLARLEHRTATAPAAAAPDVTGSVADNRPAASPGAQEPPKPLILEGWVLRDTYRGRALVESRNVLYEISPGSNLPGVGRIEKIMQQNGRWVVVTPKGLILSMR